MNLLNVQEARREGVAAGEQDDHDSWRDREGAERFFATRVATQVISDDRWAALEKEVMPAYRWGPPEALAQTCERFYPENLLELIQAASVT